jgi:hypothetical protein
MADQEDATSTELAINSSGPSFGRLLLDRIVLRLFSAVSLLIPHLRGRMAPFAYRAIDDQKQALSKRLDIKPIRNPMNRA